MSIFNLTDEKMKETSSTFTAHEIYQQPATWRKTCAQLAACKDELQAFIDQVVKQDDFDIVLVGAGTSEFFSAWRMITILAWTPFACAVRI